MVWQVWDMAKVGQQAGTCEFRTLSFNAFF